MIMGSNEIEENEVNFDRYEDQLTKIGKDNKSFKDFTKETFSQEYTRIQKNWKRTRYALSEQCELSRVFQNAIEREQNAKTTAQATLETIQQQLNDFSSQEEEIQRRLKAAEDRKPATQAPIKQLNSEAQKFQAKLSQKLLDRVTGQLSKYSDDNVTFVIERLVGLVKGVERADQKTVRLYFQKQEGITMALNRINYENLDVDEMKKLLEETEKAAITQSCVGDFKVFLDILQTICKLTIEKKEEIKILHEIETCNAELEENTRQKEAIQQRIELLQMMDTFTCTDNTLPAMEEPITNLVEKLK